MSRIAVTLIVLALIAGTSAAFTVAERLKLERSPVTAPHFDRLFSPVCDCASDVAHLRIRFRRKETVDAVIVDARGEPVRRLGENEPVRKGNHTFAWDGRDDAGEVVPDGRYRLLLHLETERRTILVPTSVWVDTKPPKVVLVRARPDAFSPDGDGRKDHMKVVYRTNEEGRPELAIDGEVVLTGRSRGKGKASFNWSGKIGGATVTAGTYELAVRVRDPAGNLSEPTRPAPVRVRFIELDQDAYAVQAGGRLTFTVDTDVESFRWYLSHRPSGGKAGRPVLYDLTASGDTVSATLSSDLEPGAYQLRVTANGHKDRAIVNVEKSGT